MNSEPGQRQDAAAGGAFNLYLRTGRRLEAGLARGPLQLKYNHYHDRENGQFTTAGSGQYFAGGGGSFGGAGATGTGVWGKGTSRFAPEHPRNHSIYVVKKGDTLNKIAAQRKGLRASDLAELNRIKNPNLLHVGQQLKLPHQSYLEAGRAAKNNMLAIVNYRDTHRGKLPPNVAKAPPLKVQIVKAPSGQAGRKKGELFVENGHTYRRDTLRRTTKIEGLLSGDNPQGRSRSAQRAAGGVDRLPTDDGGHFVAPRFGGSKADFNHFAQNANFNRGAYRVLEDQWYKLIQQGKKIPYQISAKYEGLSLRPYSIKVKHSVDGKVTKNIFYNSPKGKK